MESIKRALDRAKSGEEIKSDEVKSENDKPFVGSHEVNDGSPQFSLTKKNIQYTSTRKVALSDMVLNWGRIITGRRHNKITAAYKILRTRVLQRLKANAWNTFGVVSAHPGEGKSLTAINLAISLAQEVKNTVLLVDFDLNDPSIHKHFKYRPEKGVSDYIFNDTPLSEIMFSPGIDGLVVLPGKDSISNSSEMLSSPKVVELVEELKRRYPERIVIFDLPSLLSSDDVMAFSPYIESVLVVVEDGKVSEDDLMQALDHLSLTQVLGTVLNKSGGRVRSR